MTGRSTTISNIDLIVDTDGNDLPTLVKTGALGTGDPSSTTFLNGLRQWVPVSGGGGTPAAPFSSIQFNNSGAFGGSPLLLWDGANVLTNSLSSQSGSNLSLKSSIGVVNIGNGQANYISLFSSAVGGEPLIITQGSDQNINLALAGKGTGGVQIGQLSDPTPLIVANGQTQTAFTPGAPGQVLTSAGPGKTPYWANPTGGGGTVFSTIVSKWTTANSSNKNANSAPGVVNVDGITISLTATSNPGVIPSWTISLNGAALPASYATAGTFPNYTVTIPSADISSNAAQTAATVTVSLVDASYNLSANNLTNNLPVPFTTTLSAAYGATSVPFYTTIGTINYSYTNTNAITVFGGIITPAGGFALNATSPSGSFANEPINGATITGSATGNGLYNAGSATVTLSGSVPAVSTFIPAFYAQTADSTPPTFTSASLQTGGAAAGSSITYPAATATTQYNWVCTQRPLANLMLVTSFGSSALVPDVTAPNETIAGQVFNVYGWTRLGVGTASLLTIT